MIGTTPNPLICVPEQISQPARVARRDVVSAPSRTIQVERVRVSEAQKSAVASAIREGRLAAGKSE
jgi:hypothetical protein